MMLELRYKCRLRSCWFQSPAVCQKRRDNAKDNPQTGYENYAEMRVCRDCPGPIEVDRPRKVSA